MTNLVRGRWGRLVEPRALAIVFVAAVALLLAHNAFWLVHNQRHLGCSESVCVSPRALERVAWRSRTPKISHLALFYLLNESIPHARLSIPRAWAREKRQFEDISRLRVGVSKRRLVVGAAHVERLRRLGLRRQRMVRADVRFMRTKTVVDAELENYVFLFDDAASDYVVAETKEDGGPIFVMPRAMYAEVAAR